MFQKYLSEPTRWRGTSRAENDCLISDYSDDIKPASTRTDRTDDHRDGIMARRKRRRLASRVRAAVRGLLAFLFSNVGIIVLVVAYTIAGKYVATVVYDSHSY